jgi:hypothetical protein
MSGDHMNVAAQRLGEHVHVASQAFLHVVCVLAQAFFHFVRVLARAFSLFAQVLPCGQSWQNLLDSFETGLDALKQNLLYVFEAMVEIFEMRCNHGIVHARFSEEKESGARAAILASSRRSNTCAVRWA